MDQAQMDALLEQFPNCGRSLKWDLSYFFILLWMIKRHFADPRPDETGRPAGRLGPTGPDILGHGGDAGGSSCDIGSDSCGSGD
ncbi:MAG: hypothetical protein R3D30_11970 [Hyphomicrobiales bacterium]